MRAAVSARVSTARQAQAQSIEQQLDRLRAAVTGRGWELDDQHVYRDDGYSGASLGRPGLDRLRDHAALADLDVVLVVAPDRQARNYVHQVVLVAQLFDWYLEAGVTLYRLAKRLTDLGIATPTGKPRWNVASVRGILRNPDYTGRAQTNRTRVAPARQRKAALLPVGPGQSHAPRPPEEWVTVAVPQIVSEETFAQVQAKLDANQQGAARNTRHPYLLRALVSCGACRLSCTARTTQNGYNYYICVGRT